MTHSWIELPNGDHVADANWCPSEGAPAVTDGLVATAFRRIPLPPSTFSVQPPGGQTLVNFETNFFTEERTLDRTVRLLGQRVDLRIWAHSYTWHFGDGETITTRSQGRRTRSCRSRTTTSRRAATGRRWTPPGSRTTGWVAVRGSRCRGV